MQWNIILADASAPAAPAQTAPSSPASQGAPAAQTSTTQGTPATQPGQPQGLFTSPIIFFVLLAVIMYFLMIRPQQQRQKQLTNLLASLKSGDKVVTSGGIVGIAITVKDKTVTLRSGDAKMEVTKSSITEILEKGDATTSSSSPS